MTRLGTIALSLEDLHESFRSVVTLAALVAAINNKGHSKLKPYELSQSTVESKQPIVDVLLNSLAILLARDAGVITLAPYDPPLTYNTSADVMHVVAMEGMPCYTIPGEPVPIPDDEASHNCKHIDTRKAQGELNESHPYILVTGGESHLPHVDSWHYVLNLQ